jgi:hypothetical protein
MIDEEKGYWKKLVLKKVTPRFDLSWYLKWIASFFLLIGMALVSTGGYEPWNMVVSLIGVTGWMIVGMIWHDRALIFINGIAIFIWASGILNFFIGE